MSNSKLAQGDRSISLRWKIAINSRYENVWCYRCLNKFNYRSPVIARKLEYGWASQSFEKWSKWSAQEVFAAAGIHQRCLLWTICCCQSQAFWALITLDDRLWKHRNSIPPESAIFPFLRTQRNAIRLSLTEKILWKHRQGNERRWLDFERRELSRNFPFSASSYGEFVRLHFSSLRNVARNSLRRLEMKFVKYLMLTLSAFFFIYSPNCRKVKAR